MAREFRATRGLQVTVTKAFQERQRARVREKSTVPVRCTVPYAQKDGIVMDTLASLNLVESASEKSKRQNDYDCDIL